MVAIHGKVVESYQSQKPSSFGHGLMAIPQKPGIYTLWLFNIAMENGPFIDDFPIKTSICKGFSMAMLNNQMVYITI